MKNVINEAGFDKAMKAGKSWTTLDCQLSELEEGGWYWEIEKSTFFTENDKKDGKWEQLAYGEDDDNLAVVKTIWSNLINKYNPDEYFVDQHNL
jgi:hypothetical protein